MLGVKFYFCYILNLILLGDFYKQAFFVNLLHNIFVEIFVIMNKRISVYFFLLCNCLLRAQDAPVDKYQDSLQTIVNTTKNKTVLKESLFLLGEHLVQRNPQKAEEIATRLQKEFNVNDSNQEVIRNKYIFAASHRWQGDYKTALSLYNEIYTTSVSKKVPLDIAKSASFMGNIYMFKGNNVLAQKLLLEAASIYEKQGTAEDKAKINNALASFYLNINQFEKGKKEYLKSLAAFTILKDSAGCASVNGNLAYVYTELGDYKKAEYYFKEQRKLLRVFPTKRELGFHHDFLGILRQKEGRLQEAYKEHLTALKIREKLSSTYNLCESKLNMGTVLIKMNKLDEAVSQLQDVFKYSEHESLNQQQSAYQLLAEAYEKKGNNQLALTNYKKYKQLSDSIYSKESSEIIAEKDAQYNEQKKDSEIQLLNKEKEISESKLHRSKIILFISLLGIGILLLASFGLFKMYSKIKHKNEIIEKSLKDRELLVHETHHRVKNNLQMISSLLNLQSKYVIDKKALEALQDGRSRVESMAILHKNLYIGEQLTEVKIQDYFENLVNSILNTYAKNPEATKVIIEAHTIFMDLEKVIPISFIVNELVTNSIKHALTNVPDKLLEINVSMTQTNEHFLLTVQDNGKGYEEIPKSNKEETFGQRLINMFTQKLSAKVDVDTSNGTKVQFTIPKNDD
jgi:two-component system, sensor histidine kinase PdtaS